MILERWLNIGKTEIISDRSVNISRTQWKDIVKFLSRINRNEPIQYLLGEADFYGRKFKVTPSVLIPRNETEELVHLIAQDYKNRRIRLLDIGTGTGCIAITLAKALKLNKALAIDIDPRAIKIARQNAAMHNVTIDFMLIDILKERLPVQGLDVVVSNPPYLTDSDKGHIKSNVLDYEPATALFVNHENPLLFYEKIADHAKESLKEGGRVYFEINERYGNETRSLLLDKGYQAVTVFKDINGKDRMVRATNSLT